jgi:hypothetical protein
MIGTILTLSIIGYYINRCVADATVKAVCRV